MTTAIRNEYQSVGVDNYYQQNADTYQNPHSVQALNCLDDLLPEDIKSVLDFACGDGLVSKHLRKKYPDLAIYGCDKFLHERYQRETGNQTFSYSFEDVANGIAEIPFVDLIVFSYAIDIVEKSYLNSMLYYLSTFAKKLIVIRPNNHLVEHFSWDFHKNVKFNKSRGVLYVAK